MSGSVSVSGSWKARALAAIVEYARSHVTFTLEEVRFANPDIVSSGTARSWGAVIRQAERQEVVVKCGYRPVRSSNGSPKVLWRSLIAESR